MTADVIQYASVAGELAKNLWGRTDFEKYDTAWAIAHNWQVDYRGGLFTRPGSEFKDIIEWSAGQNIKFLNFQYSPDDANTYLLVFTDDKLRFVQDGAYVLEASVAVASLANDVGDRVQVTTGAAHGFSNGDWVKLDGFTETNTIPLNTRTVQVANVAATTFTMVDPITGDAIDIASVTTDTGSVYRIYTLVSPYGQEELEELRATQIRDTLRLTHPDYPSKDLTRSAQTSWAIADTSFGSSVAQVTGLATDGTSHAEGSYTVYQVTAINEQGEEGLPDLLASSSSGPDLIDQANRWIAIDWTAVADATGYRIYRGRVVDDSSRLFSDSTVGYIGRSIGPAFIDNGITPDFGDAPKIEYNPFANGAIRYVEVDTQGSSYDYNDTITWPAGGSGAVGYLICEVDGSSTVTGVILLNGGSGYTGTSVSSSGGSGTFAGTATLTEASGNNPHCSAIFQQRQLYGATDNNPLRLYGSRPAQLNNFSYTFVGADDDGFEFDLDSPQVAPIRHIKPLRGGILIFSEIGIWLVQGKENENLNGNNADADFQTSVGSSLVDPIYLDTFVVYVAEAGQELRMLVYDDYGKVFQGKNISLLSNHLFEATNPIKTLTYAPVPSKIVYATQENGRLLSTTIDNENNVFAVCPQETKGYYRAVQTILEDDESSVYVAVERIVNGNRVMMLERFAQRRNMEYLRDAVCLDNSLQLGVTKPAAMLTPAALTGSTTFTADSSVFVSGDVGSVIDVGCTFATITAYTSGTEVTATWDEDLTKYFPETTSPAEFVSGDWMLNAPTTSVTGLWNQEGEAVSILADGEVVTGKSVSNGSVTLDTAATRVVIGTGYTCKAQTLPLTVADVPIEGRRKDIVGVQLRMYRSIGLKIGSALDKLKLVANRGQRLWSTANALRDEIIEESVNTNWSRDNQIWFVQDSPRPAAILNFMRDVDLGDEKE